MLDSDLSQSPLCIFNSYIDNYVILHFFVFFKFSCLFIFCLPRSVLFCCAQTSLFFCPVLLHPTLFCSFTLCSLPSSTEHRSPVFGSAVGSEDEDTKAPKTILKSQSVNSYRKHISSSHNTGSHTHTQHIWSNLPGFDRERTGFISFGIVWENKAVLLICFGAFE